MTEIVERPPRLTLSRILEMMLTRAAHDHSAVTIGRTPSGATVLEVTVRTGDDEGIVTVEDAAAKAQAVYDELRTSYPDAEPHDAAEVSLTRNAKGETQVSVTAKTTPDGITKLTKLADETRTVYDSVRMKYPMADGHSARPGSVA